MHGTLAEMTRNDLNVLHIHGPCFNAPVIKRGCYLRILLQNLLRKWRVPKNRKFSIFYANDLLRADLRSKFCSKISMSQGAFKGTFNTFLFNFDPCVNQPYLRL